MTCLGGQHWTFAFMLAFVIHMAVYIFSINLPGGAPVFRGGGFVEQGRAPSPGASGIFVRLGKSSENLGDEADQAALKEQAPVRAPRQTLVQAFVTKEGAPGTGAKDPAPSEKPEPAVKPVVEPTVSPPAAKAGPLAKETKDANFSETQYSATPVARRKPKPPLTMPEMETLGRRLSVQGPPETPAQTTPAPESAANTESTAVTETSESKPSPSKADKKAIPNLSFASSAQFGTTSGTSAGDVRELNYENQVML